MLEHRWRKEETNLGMLGWSSRLSRAGGACMSAYQCAPRSDLGTASIGLTAAGLLAWPRLSEKVHRPHHATATGSDACFPLKDGEREALCCHIAGILDPWHAASLSGPRGYLSSCHHCIDASSISSSKPKSGSTSPPALISCFPYGYG